jgi:hypothetical protein
MAKKHGTEFFSFMNEAVLSAADFFDEVRLIPSARTGSTVRRIQARRCLLK